MPRSPLAVDEYIRAKPFYDPCSLMPDTDLRPANKYGGAGVDIEWDTSSHNYEQRQKEGKE